MFPEYQKTLISSIFLFIDKKSSDAFPNIDDQFDLIFIDGWHTFDNVMVDIFYSINLLKPGGYIILDDADFPSVGKAISYFIKLPNIKFEK